MARGMQGRVWVYVDSTMRHYRINGHGGWGHHDLDGEFVPADAWTSAMLDQISDWQDAWRGMPPAGSTSEMELEP